jgi:hypothetical protein
MEVHPQHLLLRKPRSRIRFCDVAAPRTISTRLGAQRSVEAGRRPPPIAEEANAGFGGAQGAFARRLRRSALARTLARFHVMTPRAFESGPSEIDETLPPPLLMNCWKHHAQSVLARVEEAASRGEAEVRALPARLVQLGGSLMDLYLGDLPLATLAAEVLEQLRAREVEDPAAFAAWVGAARGYRTLELSDGSRWVVRLSAVPGRHVHLHPARRAPHTLRITANRLRSAILALAWARLRGGDPFDVALYNESRRLLALSPVRSLRAESGVGELLRRAGGCGARRMAAEASTPSNGAFGAAAREGREKA